MPKAILKQRMNQEKCNRLKEVISNQHHKEFVETLMALQTRLQSTEQPYEIGQEVLKLVCTFYGGDLAWIALGDLELEIWKPLWWYKTDEKDRTDEKVYEFESSKYLIRWVEAIKKNQILYVEDTLSLKESAPDEYDIYKRLDMRSFIAVPFKPRMCGFIVVRNPSRYTEYGHMIQTLSYIANTAVNEHKLQELEQFAMIHPEIKHQNDIVICFFGELEIYTSKGVLREHDLNSLKLGWLLVYLLLNSKRAHSATEIFDALGGGKNKGSPLTVECIRTLIYRFRSKFGGLFEKNLIVTSKSGYQINPELRIKCDLNEFEQRCRMSHFADTKLEKIEKIKYALEIYKGPVYASASSETWLFHTANHYAMGYIEMMNQLLELLADNHDYEGLGHYTSIALQVDSGNMTAYFWKIYSIYRTGAVERLRCVLKQAKIELTSEEYENLLQKVYSNGDQNLIGLMQ